MAFKCLRSLDVPMPEEMSVVGFDNGVYAELLDPPLTTAEQPFGATGVQAAELLLAQVESADEAPRVVVVPCRLIGRQSCTAVARA